MTDDERYDLDTHIQGVAMSTMARNTLLNAGIMTLREVEAISEANLLRLPNLGRKGLKEIKRCIEMARYRQEVADCDIPFWETTLINLLRSVVVIEQDDLQNRRLYWREAKSLVDVLKPVFASQSFAPAFFAAGLIEQSRQDGLQKAQASNMSMDELIRQRSAL